MRALREPVSCQLCQVRMLLRNEPDELHLVGVIALLARDCASS